MGEREPLQQEAAHVGDALVVGAPAHAAQDARAHDNDNAMDSTTPQFFLLCTFDELHKHPVWRAPTERSGSLLGVVATGAGGCAPMLEAEANEVLHDVQALVCLGIWASSRFSTVDKGIGSSGKPGWTDARADDRTHGDIPVAALLDLREEPRLDQGAAS
jgi:hypothetical protein